MNAIEFLIREHQKVKKMLADINDNHLKTNAKRKLFSELSSELLCHEAMEHHLWYPEFKNNNELDVTVRHLISEENYAAREINQLNEIVEQDLWDKKFQAFKKAVEHHAAEEETTLFPEIRSLLSQQRLEDIGSEMHRFKQAYRSNNPPNK